MAKSLRPLKCAENAADCLTRNKEKVLHLWESRVRKEIPAARYESHPIIIDTAPRLIDQLIVSLKENKIRNFASEGSTACQEHGGERARVTNYSIENVIHEYQLMREIILEILQSESSIHQNERNILEKSFDDIMKQASMAFGLVQDTIREQFSMTLTHDLRGPLSAALTNAQMILKYPDKSEQHLKLAARIVQNISRIDKMVTDLLDANRIRAGERLKLEIHECDLQKIAKEVIEEINMIHEAKIDFNAGEVKGFWDENALRRIIENLCTNAVKYGDQSFPVTLSVSQSHGRTEISVHNHGNPIPIEEQETLFNAYRRTKSAEEGKTKGWGLGLALVRGVAEAHGGSVIIDSSPERGTTFTVDIPTDARISQEKIKQPFST